DEQNRENASTKRFTRAAREALASYRWPGNVRELRNVVQRAYVLCDEDVDVDVHPESTVVVVPVRGATPESERSMRKVTLTVGTSLDEAERALILTTLESVDGSRVQAAKMLGISLKTLYNRLNAYRSNGSDAATRRNGCRLTVVARRARETLGGTLTTEF